MTSKTLIGLILAAAACAAAGAELPLSGQWVLRQGCREPIPARVPGDSYSALFDAGLMPDPYVGTNEWLVQGFADEDAVFSRRFDCGREFFAAEDVLLEFESVDDPAEISLNGRRFTADNQFRRWRFNATGALKEKGNLLEVRLPSPRRESARRQKAEGAVPELASHGRNTMRYVNFLRRTQCQAGWDWGVSIPSSGILGDVRLRTAKTAYLDYLWHEQKTEAGRGYVTLFAELSAAECANAGDAVEVVFEFEGERRAVRAVVPRGCAPFAVSCCFEVERPLLWWPNGYGAQPLYRYSASCEGGTLRRRLGFRAVEVVRERDADGSGGESFGFRVNGVDVFAKGWNWIPTEAFPSRRTPARAEFLLREAARAHANMVRVWGGGVYEPDSFYDLCDELGLMVWQDMMFACAYYPVDGGAFRANVAAEVEHQVKRLKSHPSVALWCGDNESYWCSYMTRSWYALCDRLTTTISDAVLRSDPGRFFWPSSPCSGDRRWEENFDYDKGDSHCWGVGAGSSRPIEGYLSLRVRFMSEYGWGSYPQPGYMRRFVSSLDPASPDMRNHVKKDGAERRALAAVREYFGEPKDHESAAYLTQVMQARLLRKVQNRLHAEMPWCRGVLNWQLNDWWPVYGWSSIDHGLNLKAAMYAARRFNAPLVAFLDGRDSETGGVATVVWDLPQNATGSLSVIRRRISDGAETGRADYRFAFDCAGVKTFGEAEKEDCESFLELRVSARDGGGRLFANCETEMLSPLARTELPDPCIVVESVEADDGGSMAVVLSSRAPAFATLLSVENDGGGSFDDNFTTLAPGRREFRYRPGRPLSAEELRRRLVVRHLQGARRNGGGR